MQCVSYTVRSPDPTNLPASRIRNVVDDVTFGEAWAGRVLAEGQWHTALRSCNGEPMVVAVTARVTRIRTKVGMNFRTQEAPAKTRGLRAAYRSCSQYRGTGGTGGR